MRVARVATGLTALGVGENLGAAPLRLGADTGTGALPFGAQPPGGAGEALLHALEDARRDALWHAHAGIAGKLHGAV